MQKQNTQLHSRLSNAIPSLFNRLVCFIVLCGLMSFAQATSGTQITMQAYHQSSALYTETAKDMTVQTASGQLSVSRYFHDGAWEFLPAWGRLSIATTLDSSGQPAVVSTNNAENSLIQLVAK